MKLFSFVTLFTCLLFSAYGQKINKIETIALLDSNQIDKVKKVLLIETDSLIVLTTYNLLYKQLKNSIKKDENTIKEIQIITQKIRLDTSQKIIRLDNIPTEINEVLNYQIGDLLKFGKCFVYNKLAKRRIKRVKVMNYGNYSYGSIGKRYYLNQILLLDNTEITF